MNSSMNPIIKSINGLSANQKLLFGGGAYTLNVIKDKGFTPRTRNEFFLKFVQTSNDNTKDKFVSTSNFGIVYKNTTIDAIKISLSRGHDLVVKFGSINTRGKFVRNKYVSAYIVENIFDLVGVLNDSVDGILSGDDMPSITNTRKKKSTVDKVSLVNSNKASYTGADVVVTGVLAWILSMFFTLMMIGK